MSLDLRIIKVSFQEFLILRIFRFKNKNLEMGQLSCHSPQITSGKKTFLVSHLLVLSLLISRQETFAENEKPN